MIRPFEIRDLPLLHRYRGRGLFLDSSPTLTWGRGLVPAGAALSPLAHASGVFTSIAAQEADQEEAIIAQAAHAAGAAFARFTFIAPDSGLESPGFTALLEHLIRRVGGRGAQSLVAEVDEKTRTFEALRRSAFSIYSRQRIWRVERAPTPTAAIWAPLTSRDAFDIQRLYNALVPALVQQVEPGQNGRAYGWVLRQEGALMAYADVHSGPRGHWVQPFIHPELEDLDACLGALLAALKPRPARPAYLCLRSYSAWLGDALQNFEAEPGPPQAVMVRRLAAEVRKPALAPLPAINGGQEPIQNAESRARPTRMERQADG